MKRFLSELLCRLRRHNVKRMIVYTAHTVEDVSSCLTCGKTLYSKREAKKATGNS